MEDMNPLMAVTDLNLTVHLPQRAHHMAVMAKPTHHLHLMSLTVHLHQHMAVMAKPTHRLHPLHLIHPQHMEDIANPHPHHNLTVQPMVIKNPHMATLHPHPQLPHTDTATLHPRMASQPIESSEVKLAKRDLNQTLHFVNKIEFTDDADIKPKLENTSILEFKIEKELKKEIKEEPDDEMKTGLAALDTLNFVNKIEFTDDADIKPKIEIEEQKTGTQEFKIEVEKELKNEIKEETDDKMKTGLAVLDNLDFEIRRDTDDGQFDAKKGLLLYHESKTQHKCTICDQEYFGHQDLKHHVIAFHAHNMRIHKCSLCDEDFSKKVSIKHHIANDHEGKGKKCTNV